MIAPYRATAIAIVSEMALAAAFAASAPAQSETEAPRTGPLAPWNADSLGNHRVVLRIDARDGTTPGRRPDAVRAHIPWRRRDPDPERKNIVMIDGATGARITNLVRIDITREAGDIVFQPATVPGNYDLYFMPFRRINKSANYPKIEYQAPESTADAGWIVRHRLGAPALRTKEWRALPEARVLAYQSVDSLDAFTPMETIATPDEVRSLLARYRRAEYLVFPEDRDNSIRMSRDLPRRWIDAGAAGPFHGSADRGEFYVFQLGVYAARQSLADVRTAFGDLKGPAGVTISASRIRCFNTGGVNWVGQSFTTPLAIDHGRVQPLWIGVDVPLDAVPGDYHGIITVIPANAMPTAVKVTLHVNPHGVAAHGDDDPARLSRLRWLDSRLAEDDGIVPPFTPVARNADTISVLGRSVVVGQTGFPSHILSRFRDGNTRIGQAQRDILTAPMALVVDTGGGSVRWLKGGVRYTPRLPGAMEWSAVSRSRDGITVNTHARLEFDGDVEYQVALSAPHAVHVHDIRLEVPYARDASRYMMGLGQKGGLRPADFHWKWDVEKNQDAVWLGDVTAGMQVSLRDEHYSRPLNTNFYHLKPLVMPASWSNGGRGGCDITDRDASTTLLRCYGGARTILPGEVLRYDFRLLITPFKPLDTREHFANRYFHAFAPLDSVAKTGANVINVHHRTDINPYLNYPFLRPAAMKAYVDQAHARGMKVKIYYTVRELTDHAPELFALRSLGHEVFSSGKGGGPSWLQEHFGTDYTAGWFVPERNDATVVMNGQSRWHNFYIEGLDWLARNIGIDGIYLDDVAFDRTTMQRVRKVLDRRRTGALIDLHSANQYDPADGFASSANLYMEYFPYINRLWFGEGFDYVTTPPDYWLVEISGIPFGLMGEMLQGGGNPWRGMVYGMTNRVYNDDPSYHGDPVAIWKAWDDFGIRTSRMAGYWDQGTPVTTGRNDVLATSYLKPGQALVAIGSWAPDTARVHLRVDWRALGIDSTRAIITQPAIAAFQAAAAYRVGDAIPVAPGKGALVVIRASTSLPGARK